MLCTPEWTLFGCNAENRVNAIYFPPALPVQNGTIPSSVGNLTALKIFGEPRGLHGAVPSALWNNTLMEEIFLDDSPHTGSVPGNAYLQSLATLVLKDTSLTGTLPASLPYNSMRQIVLKGSFFDCPLPQPLESKLNSGGFPASVMSHSRFNLTDGKICGQVPVETTSAQLLPVDNGPPPRSQVFGPYGNDKIQVEFSGRAVYMYAAARRPNGSRFIYRDEYFYLDNQAISIRHSDMLMINQTGPPPNFWRAVAIGWDSRVRVYGNVDIVEADLLFTKNMTATFKFEFNNTNVPSGLKYSMTIKYPNLPNWAFEDFPGNPYGLFMEFVWGLRAPHSDLQTPDCSYSTSFNGLNRNFSCVTDICSFAFRASLDKLVFDVSTRNIELKFVWPSEFYVDSNYRLVDPRRQNFKAIFGPYPVNENHFSILRRAGISLPQIPLDEQWISFLGHLGFEPWRNELLYDPDVTLSLLFEISDPPLNVGVPGSSAINSGGNIGLIVGASVGAISAAAIIAVIVVLVVSPKFRRAVLPYQKARDTQKAAPHVDIEDTPAPTPSRAWIKSTKMEPLRINEEEEQDM